MTAERVTKAAPKSEAAAPDAMISIGQWTDGVATARAGLVSCSKDLVEIACTATDAMVGGFVECGDELRNLNSIWATVIVSSLEETGRLLAGEAASPARVKDGFSEMMTQVQNLMEVNRRLAERQVGAASAACQALATMPSRVLGSMGGV